MRRCGCTTGTCGQCVHEKTTKMFNARQYRDERYEKCKEQYENTSGSLLTSPVEVKMTQPMSPAREKELRKQQEGPDGCLEVEVLLAEIDRLRSLLDGETAWHTIAINAEKERDRFREELAVAEEALGVISKPTYGTELNNSEEENNSILAPFVFHYQKLAREALSKMRGEK